jgi:histidine triad (HIT) family protein
MKEECIFCRIVKGEIKAEKIGESENFMAIKDVNPKVEGHTLIIPKQHWITIMDIPESYGKELLGFIKRMCSKLMRELNAEGFNLEMNNFESAGQVVMHAHIHILPRN